MWGSVHGVTVIARGKRARGLGLPDMAPLPVLSSSGAAKTGAETASEPAAAAACDVTARLIGCREADIVWDAHAQCMHTCMCACTRSCDNPCETRCNPVQPKILGQFHLSEKRTARRRRTELQGIGARERKEDHETAEHGACESDASEADPDRRDFREFDERRRRGVNTGKDANQRKKY